RHWRFPCRAPARAPAQSVRAPGAPGQALRARDPRLGLAAGPGHPRLERDSRSRLRRRLPRGIRQTPRPRLRVALGVTDALGIAGDKKGEEAGAAVTRRGGNFLAIR